MGLTIKVTLQIGVRDFITIKDYSFSGHQIHQPLREKSHKQLLKEGNDQATLGCEV